MPRHNRPVTPTEVRVPRAEPEQLVRRGDPKVARLAAEEQGVLTVGELRACGLDDDAVLVRARNGRLHRQHRGVYAVGHAGLTLPGRFLAAVKACGTRAVLSHFAASAHAAMIEWDDEWPIDVTVLGVGTRRHRGLRIHRTSWLERRDWMVRDGIPVTAPWRTTLDMASLLGEPQLRRFVRQAVSDGKVSIRQLTDVPARGGPRRGSRRLVRVLAHAEPTRSELEDVVHDLILSAGFERPDVNKPLVIAGRRIVPDFRWPSQRLIVEADSRKWHDNPLARADDAERRALLEAAGERIESVTWADAVARRAATITRLAAAGAPFHPHRGTRNSA